MIMTGAAFFTMSTRLRTGGRLQLQVEDPGVKRKLKKRMQTT